MTYESVATALEDTAGSWLTEFEDIADFEESDGEALIADSRLDVGFMMKVADQVDAYEVDDYEDEA